MQAAFRQALIEGDIADLRALWDAVAPREWKRPRDDGEAAIMLHYARTASEFVPFRLRAWSHRWLCERGVPSGLPDELKPRAERLYPRVVETVGVICATRSPLFKPIAKHIEQAAADAVCDLTEAQRRDHSIVRARIDDARTSTVRKLLGVR